MKITREVRRRLLKDNIKLGNGGIIDIEFIAQYFVLGFADAYPQLTDWSDNIRIFEQLTQLQLMASEQSSFLSNSYLLLRDKIHHLTLQALPARIAISEYANKRAKVQLSFRHWLLDDVTAEQSILDNPYVYLYFMLIFYAYFRLCCMELLE